MTTAQIHQSTEAFDPPVIITPSDRRRAADVLAAAVTDDRLALTVAALAAQRADRVGVLVEAMAALLREEVRALHSTQLVDRLRVLAAPPQVTVAPAPRRAPKRRPSPAATPGRRWPPMPPGQHLRRG